MSIETTNTRSSTPDDDVISLSEILGIILSGKWWIAGSTLLFAICALAYLWIATPVYRSDALVQVESQKSPMSNLVEMTDMFGGETPSEAEIEVIRSRFVLGKVVESLKLDIVVEPDYFPVIGRAVSRRFIPEPETGELINSPLLWLSGYAWGGEAIKVERFQIPSTMLGETYTLVAEEQGRYQLQYKDEPVLAGKAGRSALSEDGQVRLFVSELKARPGTRFEITRQPMVSAIEGLGQRLAVSEKGKKTGVLSLSLTGASKLENTRALEAIIERYVRQNVERVSAEAQNSLKFLEHQLPEMKKEVELAESKLNRFQRQNKTVDLTLETQAVLEQAVNIDTQLAQIDMQIEQMGQRYTVNHPIMEELKLQRQLIVDRKKEFMDQTENLPKTQQEVMRLARDVKVSTQVYTELLNKAQELKIVKASAVGNVRILDHALSAIKPVKPKKALIAVLATLLGAMLGMGLVFLREMLNAGVKTPEEIEKRTGLSVYATVPESDQLHVLERNARKQQGCSYLLAQEASADLAVESLRSLRTNLAFALMEASDNRIMITGPAPGVGKSFIATNLAALLAETGQKVLLIDADLRKGHICKVFGRQRGCGLAELLVGKADSTVIFKATENLDVLPSGHYPPNPSELLMSPAFNTLLDKVSKDYDVVLIDTPPVLAVTDPAVVGKQCGTAFMIVRAGLNPIKEVDYAASRLKQSGVNLKGCVLNGMIQSASRYGNYGYYHYAYETSAS